MRSNFLLEMISKIFQFDCFPDCNNYHYKELLLHPQMVLHNFTVSHVEAFLPDILFFTEHQFYHLQRTWLPENWQLKLHV